MICKLKIFLTLVICIYLPNFAFANNYSSINYTISPPIGEIPMITVEVEIKGKLSDKLILDLPYKWAGNYYSEQVKNIRLIDLKGNFVVRKKNNHQIIIKLSEKTDSVKISYELHQKSGNPLDVHEVIIRNNLVHSIGSGLFAIPVDIKSKDKIQWSIQWKELPEEWNTLSSYGTGESIQFVTTAPQLLHAMYIAGNIRIHKIANDPNPVFLSLFGTFDITDNKIASSLNEIIKTQRSFFNDTDFPYYAISILEGEDPYSMGGTNLHNSFTAYLPGGTSYKDYYILFAHENLHNWIGGKIRNNSREELNYWWTEGFTDYYSRILALRSGGITLEEFILESNELLRNYYLSPVINEPNLRIKKDLWNDQNIQKLPYYRGFVFAIYLNNLIKCNNSGNSLDNVMLDLFKIAKQKEFSIESFKNITQNYVSKGIRGEISKFIEEGNTIDLGEVTALLPLETMKMGTYEMGCDRESLLTKEVIENININSNAYKAGLRNGDKVIGWNFPKGRNPDQVATITTAKKTFEFKPQNMDKKEIYQFKQSLSPEDEVKIKRFFGVYL